MWRLSGELERIAQGIKASAHQDSHALLRPFHPFWYRDGRISRLDLAEAGFSLDHVLRHTLNQDLLESLQDIFKCHELSVRVDNLFCLGKGHSR